VNDSNRLVLRPTQFQPDALRRIARDLRALGYNAQATFEATGEGALLQILSPAATGSAAQSLDLFRAVMDQIADPAVAYHPQDGLTFLNTAAEDHPQLAEAVLSPDHEQTRRLPWDPETGRPLAPEDRPTQRALGGETVTGQTLAIQTADGEIRELFCLARPVRDQTGRLAAVVAIAQERTHQRRTERALARQVQLYQALSEINQFLVTRPAPQPTYEKVCQVLVDHGGFQLAWVGLPDADGWVQPVAVYGEASAYVANLAISTDPQRPEGQGPTGTTLREGEATISRRILEDDSMGPWAATARQHGLRSSGAFPLRRGGKTIGAVNVYAADPDFLDEDLLHLIDELTLDVSFALDTYDRQQERRQFQEIIEASPDFIALADADGHILYHNPAARALLGPDWQGKTIRDSHPDWAADRVVREGLPRARDKGYWRGHTAFWDQWGQEVPFSQTIVAHRDPTTGEIVRYSTIARDMRAWQQAQNRIDHLAYYNTVSGLPNRAYLQEALPKEIQSHAEQRAKGALVLVDLDNFKAINDSLGHSASDDVLAAVGERLINLFGGGYLVAHLGGDEFAVVITRLPASEAEAGQQAEAFIDDIRRVLEAPLQLAGHRLHLSACVGVALFPGRDPNSEVVFQQATAAAYDAKKRGRGVTRFFHPDLLATARQRLAREQDLRHALEERQLDAVFQPIWELRSGALAGFELLARWDHPDHGPISPGEFIPLAEETGLIHQLGLRTLEQAVALAKAGETHCGPNRLPLGVTVNLSPYQFSDPQFLDTLAELLDRWQLPGQALKLEITENLLMQNLSHARERMARAQELGISFALDDFGTGYSSLAYLEQLPLDVLKIDRHFVTNISADAGAAEGCGGAPRIIETILSLGHHLGMDIVAEGIEHEHQSAFLTERGCQYAQGFLWGKPLARDEAMKLCAADTGSW